MLRVSHENFALKRFCEVAISSGHTHLTGQGTSNRIAIDSKIYYQFGDLRVEMPDYTIIVEVESSGGITNLAKYWECFESGRLTKPIKLLHIFRQKSINDYESHMVVWRFMCSKMQQSLGGKFEGRWIKYQDGSQPSLDEAVSIFSNWLSSGAV